MRNTCIDQLGFRLYSLGAYRAMGSYKGSRAVDLEYPLAFSAAMARVLDTNPARPRFRYVHLGGMFTRQDQEKKLWLLEYPRKIRVWYTVRPVAEVLKLMAIRGWLRRKL